MNATALEQLLWVQLSASREGSHARRLSQLVDVEHVREIAHGWEAGIVIIRVFGDGHGALVATDRRELDRLRHRNRRAALRVSSRRRPAKLDARSAEASASAPQREVGPDLDDELGAARAKRQLELVATHEREHAAARGRLLLALALRVLDANKARARPADRAALPFGIIDRDALDAQAERAVVLVRLRARARG